MLPKVRIGETIPNPEEVVKSFSRPDAGAVLIFEGRPRDDNGIVALRYEAYDDMALREMEKIREEVLSRTGVFEICLYHRKGEVKVGETSFLVVVFARHRREAFEACSLAVDLVKERVPIWKREVFEDRLGDWILGV